MNSRSLLRSSTAALFLAGCASRSVAHDSPATDDTVEGRPGAPVNLDSVTPVSGSVEGGTVLTMSGVFPRADYSVSVGGVACAPVTKLSSSSLSCVTGSRKTREGDADVVVTDVTDASVATKASAFHYFCPWTWGPDALRSCGAAPPARIVPHEQAFASLTTFQAGHGYTGSGPGPDDMNDASDFTLGAQSALIRTNGAGAFKYLAKRGSAPVDFTGKIPKVWLKIDNVAKANIVELHVGSSATDYFKFRIVAKETQQWATEGDWLSLSIPFGQPTVGNPNRSAITDVELIVQDDGTGPVTVHMNGLALVDEPVAKYPNGVVSFTFDDGYATQASVAAPILKRAGFPATAYLITELVGVTGPNTYMTAASARDLQDDNGWEIGVHSGLASVHTSGFPAVSAPDLERDIVSARAWLIDNGLNGYDQCSYPHGYFTPGTEVLSLARKYFTSCRTIFSTMRESALPTDAAKLRVYLVSSGTTASVVSARVDEAIANRQWLILVFHNLSPGTPLAGHPNDYSALSFADVVAYVQSKPIPVKTVGHVLQD